MFSRDPNPILAKKNTEQRIDKIKKYVFILFNVLDIYI